MRLKPTFGGEPFLDSGGYPISKNAPLTTSTGRFRTRELRVDFAVFIDGRKRGSLFLGGDLFKLVEEVLHGCF